MNKQLSLIATLSALVACAQLVAAEEKTSIGLNPAALQFARELIREGRVMTDKKGAWRGDQSSTTQENEFVRAYGFEEYGKWHLGLDNRHSLHSKSHYKFPFGDFKAIHRCGLLAVKARAHEYGYFEIEAAADQLLVELQSARPRGQKGVD